MSDITKIVNYGQKQSPDSKISDALDTLVRELELDNGSIKIFVHQGIWGPRLEIQRQVNREIKKR